MSRSASKRSLRTQAKLVFILIFRGWWLPGLAAAALLSLPSLDPLIQRADPAKRAQRRSMTSPITNKRCLENENCLLVALHDAIVSQLLKHMQIIAFLTARLISVKTRALFLLAMKCALMGCSSHGFV